MMCVRESTANSKEVAHRHIGGRGIIKKLAEWSIMASYLIQHSSLDRKIFDWYSLILFIYSPYERADCENFYSELRGQHCIHMELGKPKYM